MTFDEWWEKYSLPEHFNEPLDTLRYSDHDDPQFDEYIKGVAKIAWDASAKNGEAYRDWVVKTDNGRRLVKELLRPARGRKSKCN